MELVLWILCILVCILIIVIIWVNKPFSRMFMNGIKVCKKEIECHIINYDVNTKYSGVKIYNAYILGIIYFVSVYAMDIVYNLAGVNNACYLRVVAVLSIIVIIFGFINLIRQKNLFKKIIYPLMYSDISDESYIDDVIKYRKNTNLGIAVQTLILLMLLCWMLLVVVYPDAVLVYPLPKLSIIAVFGYFLNFFVNDSNLDAIYWKYYSIDFKKFINKVFKKEK